MAFVDLTDWLDDFGRPGTVWYVKRLSGNDTLANGTHQAGPYIPKELLFSVFPSLNRPADENPDVRFDAYIDSHADHRKIRAVWYNNKLRGGTRNEARLTNFGGSASAVLDPESTGALTIFAFVNSEAGEAQECHIWVCRSATEEDLIEERIGVVEPGNVIMWSAEKGVIRDLFTPLQRLRTDCRLEPSELPPAWRITFPSGEEIIRKAVELRRDSSLDPDERLVRRRKCEYEIFLSVEEAIELPAIQSGFSNIDDFVAKAQSILQRRKSRSGRSLELHAREILIEEGLKAGTDFDYQATSETGKSPDFLFPSAAAYSDNSFPTARLRMLAVKTTFRDRWRQILEEADRIAVKHLLTMQEGVSVGQFQQISEAGIRLVVPAGLHSAYPIGVRNELLSFEDFLGEIRLIQQAW